MMEMSAQASEKRLLTSIHDVGPRFESEVDQLAELVQRQLGDCRFAMLVVPDHWNEAPLAAAPQFQRRLRAWSDAGIEMFVHGWFHRDTARHTGAARMKARWMTASEGEFLGLSADDAARRMADGRKLVEDIIGRPAAGFIAPAWLYGPGAMTALAASGFALAEDHWRVWQPATNTTLASGPVITWASRSAPRRASSYAVARIARAAFHPLAVCRIAVHPGDTRFPRIIDSIGRTLAAFAARRSVGRYADLLPDQVAI